MRFTHVFKTSSKQNAACHNAASEQQRGGPKRPAPTLYRDISRTVLKASNSLAGNGPGAASPGPLALPPRDQVLRDIALIADDNLDFVGLL